jgi:hypothetical protein
MGSEAKCAVDYDGTTSEAKVLLETDELIVRGPLRLVIPVREMSTIEADDRRLKLRWDSHAMSLELGSAARRWAEKIRNPKSLVQKLGIKAGQKISIAGALPKTFIAELRELGADVGTRLRQESDIVFFAVDRREELDRLAGIRRSLAAGGALWVVRPKGVESIPERDVLSAGKSAGLVDVKVARFSATHTAAKFVIPVSKRTTPRNQG